MLNKIDTVRGIQNRIEDIKSTISSLEAELSDLVNDLSKSHQACFADSRKTSDIASLFLLLDYIGRCARQNHGNVSPFSESSWSDMHSTPESSPTTASPDPVPVTPPSLFFSTLQLQSKPFSPAPRKRTPTVPEQPRLATLSRDEIAKSLASDPLLEGHTPKPTALERYKPMDMKVAEPTSCRQVLQREVLCFHCNKPCIPTPRITRSDNRNR